MKTLKATFLLCLAITLSSISYSQRSSDAKGGKSLTKDFDGDGFLSYKHGGTDCNDLNFRINPGAKPNTDGGDCNCNGIVDYQETVFKFGDINRSQRIDVSDLAIILSQYGDRGSSTADVNRDLRVDQGDLENLLNTYNTLTYGF